MITHVHVWGELACFTRPEMKVERVSYPVLTPSAARGILEAILFRPQFRWRVRRIAVKRPIRFLAFRRNEVKSRLSARNPEPLLADEDRTQRNTLALRDVAYIIEAAIELTSQANAPRRKPPGSLDDDAPDSPTKYLAMFQRRVEKGQCFAQPFFGCREFTAHFEPADVSAMQVEPGVNPDTELGLVLYDVFDLDRAHPPGKVQQPEPHITFFRAALKRGILVEQGQDTLPDWRQLKPQLGGAL